MKKEHEEEREDYKTDVDDNKHATRACRGCVEEMCCSCEA
jgi:hypothetical protein